MEELLHEKPAPGGHDQDHRKREGRQRPWPERSAGSVHEKLLDREPVELVMHFRGGSYLTEEVR